MDPVTQLMYDSGILIGLKFKDKRKTGIRHKYVMPELSNPESPDVTGAAGWRTEKGRKTITDRLLVQINEQNFLYQKMKWVEGQVHGYHFWSLTIVV